MMVLYNTFNIIVIGGDYTSGVEVYNFGKEKWEIMPSLSHERGYGCTYLHNEQYLYVFGGVTQNKKQCDDIEIFALVNRSENKWRTVIVKNAPCIKGAGTKKLNENETLIVGGEGSGVNFYDYCHCLNINELAIYEKKEISCHPNYHFESMMIELAEGEFFEK